jgi:hypothetical protein
MAQRRMIWPPASPDFNVSAIAVSVVDERAQNK